MEEGSTTVCSKLHREYLRVIIMKKTVLVVVDAQKDFFYDNKSGFKAVENATDIIDGIQEAVNKSELIIYTLDTHLEELYEKSSEAEIFPIHCNLKNDGWNLIVKPNNIDEDAIRKVFLRLYNLGSMPHNEFTIIRDNGVTEGFIPKDKFNLWEGNGAIDEFISELRLSPETHKIQAIGVATDYCVKFNAEGWLKRGYEVKIESNLVKGITTDYNEVCEYLNNLKCKGKLLIDDIPVKGRARNTIKTKSL